MKRILITGASGNVGSAIVRHLSAKSGEIFLGSHKTPLQRGEVYFNFDDLQGSEAALKNIDILFLLRPPHIADTTKYFSPLISRCKDAGVSHIIFLSVQGAERKSIIPHHKIEKMIIQSGIHYTFVRPSYFMQNLTTTLRADILRREIFLPAGRADFLWIDVDDIGRAVAAIIGEPEKHVNTAYELTGTQYFNFAEVALKLTSELGTTIHYKNPGLLHFMVRKVREGVPFAYALVMVMLHYLPRFERTPPVTNVVTNLTGHPPKTLDKFIREHREEWLSEL